MNSKELHNYAEEVVEEVLDTLEIIDAKQDSRWKRPSKSDISYLLSTVGTLCSALLEFSTQVTAYSHIIALKDKEIVRQEREIMNLKLKIDQTTQKVEND